MLKVLTFYYFFYYLKNYIFTRTTQIAHVLYLLLSIHTCTAVAFFFDFSKLASDMSSVTIQDWCIAIRDLARMIEHNYLSKQNIYISN